MTNSLPRMSLSPMTGHSDRSGPSLGMESRVRQWFDSIDADRNGRIGSRELHGALARGNLHFSLSTVTHMIRLHKVQDLTAPGNEPELTYPEFQHLHRFLEDTQQSFTNAHPTNGLLSYNQLADILKGAGYHLQQKLFTRMLEVFDPEGSQGLDLTAFIRLTMFLRSSTAAFVAYDPKQTGRITLDFNQFLYAATNLI